MRDHFAQNFESFPGKIVPDRCKSSRMTTGPRQTGDQTSPDWVARCRKYDGDRTCRLLQCHDGRSPRRDDDVDLELGEFGCEFVEALGMSLHPAILDCYRAPFNPTEFTQPNHKRIDPFGSGR